MNELKSRYYERADSFASKQGLASFIWRELITSKTLNVSLRDEVKEAWEEKRKSVVSVSNRLEHKFKQEIESKEVEISILKKNLLASSPTANEPIVIVKKKSGCSSCGAIVGCYCR